MIEYTLGFVFSANRHEVLLRFADQGPEGVRGSWNGFGGKVLGGDTPMISLTKKWEKEILPGYHMRVPEVGEILEPIPKWCPVGRIFQKGSFAIWVYTAEVDRKVLSAFSSVNAREPVRVVNLPSDIGIGLCEDFMDLLPTLKVNLVWADVRAALSPHLKWLLWMLSENRVANFNLEIR